MIRVLMPSIVDPQVQVGGAWTVTRALVRLLEEGPLGAEVHVVATRRRSRAGHLLRQCTAIGRAIVSEQPAKIEFSRSRRILSEVEHLLRQQHFDLVVLNGSDLLWLLPYLPREMLRVVVAHNIEHHLFASQLGRRAGRRGISARWLQRDCERLQRFELEGLRRAHNVVFLSSADAQYAVSECPGLRAITLPPIFDGPRAPRPVREPGADALEIGMLANFEWWPNRQGLQWFLREIFPHLRPQIRLHLFGSGSVRTARRSPRIVAHGYVHHVGDAWRTCDFMICPILSGSGVCVKLAEAIYNGVPVLATHFAARGLPLSPHPAIALRDGADTWVRFLNQEGPGFARQTVPSDISARFSSDAHTRALSDFMLGLIR
jgi:glycosyltransferase involved in cell wall biosynthesis